VRDSGAPRIKFCGITRPADAKIAAQLGAAYVGVIFADSPRRVDEETARAVFEAAGTEVGHVAVFGEGSIEDVALRAADIKADIIQLHTTSAAKTVDDLRRTFRGRIWAVVSVDPNSHVLPPEAGDLAAAADGVLLDARVSGRSGGTGRTLSWQALVASVAALSERTDLILAGGLTAENVAEAIGALRPDVVDVSSGVEHSPGVKDALRMEAFAEAVRSASIVGENPALPTSLEPE
jgi:phosphoribosylanthranilate isomerase